MRCKVAGAFIRQDSTNSPDDEIFDDLTDEEYEKRITEGENVLNEDHQHGGNGQGTNRKCKAIQLQSVAKKFGSIGKSMRIKKKLDRSRKLVAVMVEIRKHRLRRPRKDT